MLKRLMTFENILPLCTKHCDLPLKTEENGLVLHTSGRRIFMMKYLGLQVMYRVWLFVPAVEQDRTYMYKLAAYWEDLASYSGPLLSTVSMAKLGYFLLV